MIKRGITINSEIHTGNDLDFLLISKNIGMPEQKLLTINIPGCDGVADYSEYLDGVMHYNNRTVTYNLFYSGNRAKMLEVIGALQKYHGHTVKVIDDDCNDFYYEGRATVEITELKGRYCYLSFSINAFPYRLKTNLTVINHTFSKEETIYIPNNQMPTVLSVKVFNVDISGSPSDGADYGVQIKSGTNKAVVTLSDGVKEIDSFLLKSGRQALVLTVGIITAGSFAARKTNGGNVQLSFREGKF